MQGKPWTNPHFCRSGLKPTHAGFGGTPTTAILPREKNLASSRVRSEPGVATFDVRALAVVDEAFSHPQPLNNFNIANTSTPVTET